MPIRLNWLRGRNFGLGMIFLGVIGLTQVIFIIIAQYGLQIGSADLVTLIPIGVTLALFYSIVIIFESNTFIPNIEKPVPTVVKRIKKKRFHGR